MYHQSSLTSSRIPVLAVPSRPSNDCCHTNIPTPSRIILRRTRFVHIMTPIHRILSLLMVGLLLSFCHPRHGVMAFSTRTHRWILSPLSTTSSTTGTGTTNTVLLSSPSPNRHSRQNIYETALYQETQRRHAAPTTTTTTTIATTSSTTKTNQPSKYKYFVDTLPSFFQVTPTFSSSSSSSSMGTATIATATSRTKTHKSKLLPMSTGTTSRIIRKRKKQFQKTIRNINSDLLQLVDTITNTITSNVPVPVVPIDRLSDILYTCIIPFWYLLPSLLCFVPIYTLTVWQTIPVTPDVWKLVNMDFIWWYYTHKHHAISVIFTFLASNASFFLAALVLLKQSHPVVVTATTTPKPTKMISPSLSSKAVSSSVTVTAAAMPSSLGYWVLAAGIMSTIFHTVQACGNYRIAEALCYLDHGIAGTAICHFYNRCGTPSLRTILCGIIAFVTLAFPITSIHLPSYTTLHSIWHTLAAATAVLWAYDATHAISPQPPPPQQPLVE